MTELRDCTGQCRSCGTCDCGAIVNDRLIVPRTVRVALNLSDGERPGIDHSGATMTTIIDAALIDAEAAKPNYDWARGRIHVDGTPLDKHFARLNLIRGSAAGQRVEAARDQMIHHMEGAHATAEPQIAALDAGSAYAAMCDDLSKAWR